MMIAPEDQVGCCHDCVPINHHHSGQSTVLQLCSFNNNVSTGFFFLFLQKISTKLLQNQMKLSTEPGKIFTKSKKNLQNQMKLSTELNEIFYIAY